MAGVVTSEGTEPMKGRIVMILLVLAGILSIAFIPAFAQTQNKGAAEIVLEGGALGNVHFPHQRHEAKLVDCMICHSAYPQKAGAIEELKAQGKLAKKQIMNEQCTKCHKERKQAGEKAGPTSCTKCHVKS
jgi:uncharacterized membrane protein